MAWTRRFAGNGLYEWLARSSIKTQSVAVGTMIMCAYTDGLLYEATVQDISGQPGQRKFTVHYPAWGESFDEVVDEAKAAARFHTHAPDIAEYFEILHRQKHVEGHDEKLFGIVPPLVNMELIAAGSMLMYAHTDGLLYEARVQQITSQSGMRTFRIHFPAWGKTHDKVVDEAMATALFHEHSPEIAKYFKNLRKLRLAEERKGKRNSKRRSADGAAPTISKFTDNESGTAGKPGSSSRIRQPQNQHTACANQHQAEDRFEDFYTFFVRAYKKRNGAADFISKTSIAKEIRRHATDYRFTDSEISAYFKRLNDGGIIMFVDGYEDQFMVI